MLEYFDTKSIHLLIFQEYRQAIEILRKVYFQDVSNIDEIRRRNIDLTSDIMFVDSTLKAIELQAIANNRAVANSEPKNTFLFRLKRKIFTDRCSVSLDFFPFFE